MVFDLDRRIGELQHISVTEAKARPVFGRGRLVDDRLARTAAAVDHADLLAAQPPAQDAAVAGFESGLVHIELIRVDAALHDVFAQSPGGGDEGHIGVT